MLRSVLKAIFGMLLCGLGIGIGLPLNTLIGFSQGPLIGVLIPFVNLLLIFGGIVLFIVGSIQSVLKLARFILRPLSVSSSDTTSAQ